MCRHFRRVHYTAQTPTDEDPKNELVPGEHNTGLGVGVDGFVSSVLGFPGTSSFFGSSSPRSLCCRGRGANAQHSNAHRARSCTKRHWSGARYSIVIVGVAPQIVSVARRGDSDPCKKAACRIQTCLRENNFQESKCADVLEAMRQCCLDWHQVSVCCSGIKLDPPAENPDAKPKQTPTNKISQ
ncbi:uncharacterized protein LOC143909188 [Arctopsyche grandis]|uniref:uncharacterized protein LOC143909188 n=1 Tax=Arctopsyche grandis TaxID=121162 RepID=UPI00406D98FE